MHCTGNTKKQPLVHTMKKTSLSWSLAGLSLMAVAPAMANQTIVQQGIFDKTPSLIAIQNATVYTEPGKKLANATLVINKGKVVSVNTKGDVPAGARVIDLAGYTIYPGFIDPYTSYGVDKAKAPDNKNSGPQYTNKSKGGNAGNDAIKPEQNWVLSFKADAKAAKPYIDNGFTAVQSAQLDGIFRGTGFVASLGEGRANSLIYDDSSLQFVSFDKGVSRQAYPSSLMGSIALIRQTLSDANWYEQSQGKTDNRYFNTPIEYNSALAALMKVEQQGVLFETAETLSLLRADKLMADFSVPTVHVGSGREYGKIKQIKATQDTIIVPVNFPKAPRLTDVDDGLDVSLATLRHWERAPTNPAVLAQNNVSFAFSHHGLKKTGDFWPNIRKAVKHGLPKTTALAALTTVPAKIAGVSDKVGKLTQGKAADFVVVKGDIFDDGKIYSVWTQGVETSLMPIDNTDFSGNYLLNVNNAELTLSITDEEKLSGKVTLGDKKSSLASVAEQGDVINFSVDLADVGIEGVYRFKGEFIDGSIQGELLDGLGNQSFITLAKVAVEANDNKDVKDKNADDAISYVSRMTLPNRAFGVDALPTSEKLHIKNATVWTSDKAGILENADVLVIDGKFKAVGQNIKTPRGYTVIDATGKHVTAGIVDEHSHIAISKGVNEGSEAVTSEVRIGDVVNPDDIHIYRSLAGGTTTAQLLHGSANPIGGQAQVIRLKWGESAENIKFTQATPSIKFALGENVKQSNWGDDYNSRYPQTRMGVETVIKDAFQTAKEYQKNWSEYNDLGRRAKKSVVPPRKDYRLQTLVEILDDKRVVHTHSYVASEILMLIELADSMDFSIGTFTHILEGYKVADEMAKHGSGGSTFSDWWAYKFEVYDAIPGNTCLMQDNGVLVSVNSDSNDTQRRLNQEAAKSMVYCDMSPEDALNMVTINPAKQLHIDKYVGSITKGKQADFVIWDNNPLSVYAQVEQTYIEGKRYFDINDDKLRQQAVVQEKNALIQKALNAKEVATDEEDTAQIIHDHFSEYTEWHCEDIVDVWHMIRTYKGAH